MSPFLEGAVIHIPAGEPDPRIRSRSDTSPTNFLHFSSSLISFAAPRTKEFCDLFDSAQPQPQRLALLTPSPIDYYSF